MQNFNHFLNELTGTLSTNSNFSVSVLNFNYNVGNIQYPSDISKFSCSLNFNVTFCITSKQDNGTLTFTNTYTYNNLKLTPIISAIGLNAYGAFSLSNDNNSLSVNYASYFKNMKISGS
ncbi:hypothetical protein J6W20_03760 [bacterium]|nr:hypothetical protein [bacterium]